MCFFKPNISFPPCYFLKRDHIKVVFVDETELGGPGGKGNPQSLAQKPLPGAISLKAALQRKVRISFRNWASLQAVTRSSVATPGSLTSPLQCLLLDQGFSTTHAEGGTSNVLLPGNSVRDVHTERSPPRAPCRRKSQGGGCPRPRQGRTLSELHCPRPSCALAKCFRAHPP